MAHTDPEISRLWDDFHALVNMPSPDLQAWLGTAPNDPDAYLYDPDVDAPALGRAVLTILEKRRTDLTRSDIDAMRQVVDVASAWLANPRTDAESQERWRRSLMCLGHDPVKD